MDSGKRAHRSGAKSGGGEGGRGRVLSPLLVMLRLRVMLGSDHSASQPSPQPLKRGEQPLAGCLVQGSADHKEEGRGKGALKGVSNKQGPRWGCCPRNPARARRRGPWRVRGAERRRGHRGAGHHNERVRPPRLSLCGLGKSLGVQTWPGAQPCHLQKREEGGFRGSLRFQARTRCAPWGQGHRFADVSGRRPLCAGVWFVWCALLAGL